MTWRQRLTIDDRKRRIESLKRFARWSDSAIRIPGTNWRFGWDSIIGLIPGLGDLAGMAMSAYVIEQARRCGVTRGTLSRMTFNAVADSLIGSIPIVGDLFDVGFKANHRNVVLAERDLEIKS